MIEVVGSAPLVGGVVNKEEVARSSLREKVERLSSKDKEWVARLCAALSPPLHSDLLFSCLAHSVTGCRCGSLEVVV